MTTDLPQTIKWQQYLRLYCRAAAKAKSKATKPARVHDLPCEAKLMTVDASEANIFYKCESYNGSYG